MIQTPPSATVVVLLHLMEFHEATKSVSLNSKDNSRRQDHDQDSSHP